jgi:hypothetical protein
MHGRPLSSVNSSSRLFRTLGVAGASSHSSKLQGLRVAQLEPDGEVTDLLDILLCGGDERDDWSDVEFDGIVKRIESAEMVLGSDSKPEPDNHRES